MATPLVSVAWLREHQNDPDLRIVDTRFVLGKPDAGRAAFDSGHIPTAVFADLERDLCAVPQPDRQGGRHPLPTIPQLETSLSQIGISNDHHVIAYDDPSMGTGFYAAHLWWLLRYLGHDRVSVLDGGLPAWIAEGGTLDTEEHRTPGRFQARPQPAMMVDANYVQSRTPSSTLVDSRAPERFRGEVEPLDWKAGHIPGAINRNWADGLRDGHWKPAEEQQARFSEIQNAEEIIVYCGSGVSACGNLLALELAGIETAKRYPGSWSDWISDNTRPIATL